jgi:UDPglucose--hexose-1-phosphate uridylyltransferase
VRQLTFYSLDKYLEQLYRTESVRGKCYVICFSPRHDLTIAQLGTEEIATVIEAWSVPFSPSPCVGIFKIDFDGFYRQDLYRRVSTDYPWIKYIQMYDGLLAQVANP